jgi:hypothetical protein
MPRSTKLLRLGFFAIVVFAAAFAFTFRAWSFTTSRLNAARSIGVFPSPTEGMLTLVQSDYVGIQEARIMGAEQEIFLGGPHIWFVTVCVWAESRADGSPVGSSTHDFDYGGSYFLDSHEGWVLMPETSSPLMVGFWMPIFDLAGDDPAQPFHDPSGKPRQPCLRQARQPSVPRVVGKCEVLREKRPVGGAGPGGLTADVP